MNYLDLFVAAIFLIEFLKNYHDFPKPKLKFFFKRDTFIDIITILPPILNLII